MLTNRFSIALFAALLATPVLAQTGGDVFTDGADNAKVHKSGFVCPLHMATFERDAAGQSDIDTAADFCSYAALDGVYGTIKLIPLTGVYDPKASMVQDFTEQEQTGSHKISEGDVKLGGSTVYARTYETSKLEDLHYRVTFAGAGLNGWAVEVTTEFADPRDTPEQKDFLDAVYEAAAKEIAAAPALAATPTPR
jgi:hypothetical protein